MIPKGNQRGGGQQLATHLLNSFDNDSVEIADVRGAVADDLHGAFAEWSAQAKATQCRKYLYSLSANPDHRQGPFKREDYLDFIGRVEKKLGLENQPRAVVFHVKGGREHCHVVWSRIDTQTTKAILLSHDRQKLRTTAQEFARDHGITLPEAMRKNRGKDRFPDHAKTENLQEKQQQERTGVSKSDRRRDVTAAWKESTDDRSFVEALQKRGYYLARGDKRGFVIVDLYGEIHSLTRQLEGVSGKDVKARLANFSPEKIAPAAKAQDYARTQRDARLKDTFNEKQKPTPTQRLAALKHTQALRREILDRKEEDLNWRHKTERDALRQMQQAEIAGIANARIEKQPKGLTAFLTRITGIQMFREARQRKEDAGRAAQHRDQNKALEQRQSHERQEIERQSRALTLLETRERQSVQIALHREEFKAIAAVGRQPTQKIQEPQKAPPRETKTTGLAGVFNRSAEETEGDKKPQPQESPKNEPGEQEPDKLTEAFNRRAAQKEKQAKEADKDTGRDSGRSRGPQSPQNGRGR